MSKHRLPLDSPNWTPVTEDRLVCERTGDRRLAAQDLTDAMVPCRCCYVVTSSGRGLGLWIVSTLAARLQKNLGRRCCIH